MRIYKDNTIALMIDYQSKLMPHMHHKEQLLKNVPILLQGIIALDIPLIISEQYRKGLGDTIEEFRTPLHNYSHTYFEKTSFSCCDDPLITSSLADYHKKNILVFGIESHICVQQTVIDLLHHNYSPVVITDCLSSRKETDYTISLKRMAKEGAILATYESILFELCRYSGTNKFKTISKLIK